VAADEVTKPMRADGMRGTVLETMWQLSAGDDKKPKEIVTPTRRCIQTCVWEDGPNGRTHHTFHKADDSGG
jgi:hypothetical protein